MIKGTPPITAEIGEACRSWSAKSSGTAWQYQRSFPVAASRFTALSV